MSAESTQRTRRTQRNLFLAIVSLVSLLSSASSAFTHRGSGAQQPDEITHLLQDYVRLDTSNPPGDTRKAADFLAGVFQRDGTRVERYESAPGKAIPYARP